MAEVVSNAPTVTKQALPLFYKQVEALNPARHGKLGLKAQGTYDFAKSTNSVPINAVEFGMASRCYPIVFGGDERALPVIVFGLQAGENVFVNQTGRWERGQYVPAYIRRYPFIAVASPSSLEFALCVDAKSNLLEENGARPLFDDGKPSALTKQALEFCQAFQAQQEFTRQFSEAVAKQELLSTRAARVKLKTGETRTLSGFRLIDERKFNALPDEVFLGWRGRGWIGLIYSHLASQTCWTGLVDRAARPSPAS